MPITLYSSIFLLSFSFLVLLIRYSAKLGLIDTPNQRSMHKVITPRSGGIAIFLSIIVSQFFFNLDHLVAYFPIYLSIVLIFIIGFIDDKYNISPRYKFIFIFIASIILYYNNVQITTLGTYCGYSLTLPSWFIFPFTFFAIAGFTNALNLIDGLDGLSSSISLIILSAFLFIGQLYHDDLMITLSASFITATFAFILFNWNPAKIFMGDTGSLTLGIVIAILSILSIQYIQPASVLFIIAMPLLDTFVVMTRRLQRGVSPFKADKNHMHHFLFAIKVDVKFVVILLAAIQAAFTIIGVQLHGADNFLSLVLFCILFFIFLNLFDQRLRRRKKLKKIKKRQRALHGKIPDMLEDEIVNPTPEIL